MSKIPKIINKSNFVRECQFVELTLCDSDTGDVIATVSFDYVNGLTSHYQRLHRWFDCFVNACGMSVNNLTLQMSMKQHQDKSKQLYIF